MNDKVWVSTYLFPPERLKEVSGTLNVHLAFCVRRYRGRVMRMTTYLNIVSTLECSGLFFQSAMSLYVMAHDYAQRDLGLSMELRLGYL